LVPVEDMGDLGRPVPVVGAGGPIGDGDAALGPARRSIWPSIHPMLLDLIRQHRSTLVFVNARRLAERLASRLNELAADEPSFSERSVPPDGTARAEGSEVEVVKAHHGSLSREQRLVIEDELKQGRLAG